MLSRRGSHIREAKRKQTQRDNAANRFAQASGTSNMSRDLLLCTESARRRKEATTTISPLTNTNRSTLMQKYASFRAFSIRHPKWKSCKEAHQRVEQKMTCFR